MHKKSYSVANTKPVGQRSGKVMKKKGMNSQTSRAARPKEWTVVDGEKNNSVKTATY